MSLEIETVFRGRVHSRSVVLVVLRALAEKLRLHWRKHKTSRALSGLSDAELQDIGLTRTRNGYRELHTDRYGAHYWHL